MRILKTIDAFRNSMVEAIPYTDKIVCNKCETVLWDSIQGAHKKPSYMKWQNEDHEWHLCQSCYEDVIETFVLKFLKLKTAQV